MGNPALEEFHTRLSEQLADALLDETAAMMVADRNVPDEVLITHPVTFTKGNIRLAVEKITQGWQAKLNRNLFRDANSGVHDGMDLQGPYEDPVTDIVRLEVSAFYDRNETPEESTRRQDHLAALTWKPEQGPPPKSVSVSQLLDQNIWWVPRGAQPIRLVDMEESHRRNLAAFLRRNAAGYKEREWLHTAALMAGPLGPSGDMAQNAAESELDRLVNVDPLLWLSEKPLLRALIPTVYLWQAGRVDGLAHCYAVHEDGSVIANFACKRRRTALAAIRPPAAEKAYREALGGIGPAFYQLVALKAQQALPEATARAFVRTSRVNEAFIRENQPSMRTQPTEEEPPCGTVIAYRCLGHSGVVLDYVSLRAYTNGLWYTTGKTAAQGIRWEALLDIIQRHGVGTVRRATAWVELDYPRPPTATTDPLTMAKHRTIEFDDSPEWTIQ